MKPHPSFRMVVVFLITLTFQGHGVTIRLYVGLCAQLTRDLCAFCKNVPIKRFINF